jgi:hypothetical protein
MKARGMFIQANKKPRLENINNFLFRKPISNFTEVQKNSEGEK